MKTRVYITVDVECAEERRVGGVVQPPIEPELRVFGRFDNQPRELGVGLIMDELESAGLAGTFFVEVLSSGYFGETSLRETCHFIKDRGHDVQLHIHPVLRQPDWISKGLTEVEDDIGHYSEEEQTALLNEGISLLEAAGMAKNEIRAFRAGNYGIDNRTWRAMSQVGLTLSSNYNLNYLGKSCRIGWPRTEAALFDTGEGVLELPISCFRDPSGYRHLQITAVSSREMQHYLLEAHRLGIPEVTLVTHSFEFFHLDDLAARRGRENSVNVGRIRSLCRFLQDKQDLFEVDTVGRLATVATPENVTPSGDQLIPEGSRSARWVRMAEQVYKRAEARFPKLSTFFE